MCALRTQAPSTPGRPACSARPPDPRAPKCRTRRHGPLPPRLGAGAAAAALQPRAEVGASRRPLIRRSASGGLRSPRSRKAALPRPCRRGAPRQAAAPTRRRRRQTAWGSPRVVDGRGARCLARPPRPRRLSASPCPPLLRRSQAARRRAAPAAALWRLVQSCSGGTPQPMQAAPGPGPLTRRRALPVLPTRPRGPAVHGRPLEGRRGDQTAGADLPDEALRWVQARRSGPSAWSELPRRPGTWPSPRCPSCPAPLLWEVSQLRATATWSTWAAGFMPRCPRRRKSRPRRRPSGRGCCLGGSGVRRRERWGPQCGAPALTSWGPRPPRRGRRARG